MIKIDKGVEMPNFKSKYPWGKMEIGDSFLLDTVKSCSVFSVVNHAKKDTPAKIFSAEKLTRVTGFGERRRARGRLKSADYCVTKAVVVKR